MTKSAELTQQELEDVIATTPSLSRASRDDRIVRINLRIRAGASLEHPHCNSSYTNSPSTYQDSISAANDYHSRRQMRVLLCVEEKRKAGVRSGLQQPGLSYSSCSRTPFEHASCLALSFLEISDQEFNSLLMLGLTMQDCRWINDPPSQLRDTHCSNRR